ncbi:MAG: hypothetical protein L6R35_003474 [Caloplaca aegaea]|nr:MAG: hypothetical protein L6R35_003474 [Caloplaca aegaea]
MASAQQVLLPQAFSSLPALPDFSSSPSALYPMLAFTFAALLLLALASWHCIVYPKVFSPLRHLPEPAGGSYLMGHFYHLIREPLGQPIREWINKIPHKGLIRYLDYFNTERIAVVGSKALADVLVHKADDFTKPPQFVRVIGNVIGVGLVLAEGEEHKMHRKALLPAFSYRNIKDLFPAFWSKSRELTHSLAKHLEAVQDEHVDLDDWVSRATLDIIGLAAFGYNYQTISHPSGLLAENYRKILTPDRWTQLALFLNFVLPPWLRWLAPIRNTSDNARAFQEIKTICRQMIQRQRARLATSTDSDLPIDRDILSVAIATGAFSDEDLVNQLMTFLAAGHETTAAAMKWSIYELCLNPLIQHRIREELWTSIPAHHLNYPNDQSESPYKDFQAAHIDQCAYLQAFCSEILRVHPPVPFTARVATHDTSITGTFIPKGTTLVLSPWAVNRSVELWGADAHVFRPDRWLMPPNAGVTTSGGLQPEYSATRPRLERQKTMGPETPYAFLTFLHGPRSCIGQSFARAELACLIAAWVLAFETEFCCPEKCGESGLGGKTYAAGVEVVVGISARPGNLKVKVRSLGKRQ